MRLARVVSVCAVMATSLGLTSLGLFATGASAFEHPSRHCRVTMHAVPWHIEAGEPVVIFGRVLCFGRANAAGQVVKLFHHLRGVPGFAFVQSTTTDGHGFYQFQNADAPVDTNRIWHVRSRGAESPDRSVRVAAQVTLSGPAEGTQILTGAPNKVTFTGTVNPVDEGARVLLQRQNALTGNEWHTIDVGSVQANGSFSIVHTFVFPGDASIRVLVRSQRRNAPSESNVLGYEISQAENSELTIESSPDPIVYGQSAIVSGVLAGGAAKPVTLLARAATQRGFTPVAQATTDAGGNYAFPAQSPVNSTFYEVQGDGKTSTVLFEAVKYSIAAQVSATSVQEGQPLTFSGSVAPSRPGHVVYLERRDVSGSGFHVVQVGTLTAASTFSIAYQVYQTGSQVFRVYVPGGPENASAASEPFTIQVTPAPAGALTPEGSGNSTLPPEGSSNGQETPSEGGEASEGPGEHAGRHGKR